MFETLNSRSKFISALTLGSFLAAAPVQAQMGPSLDDMVSKSKRNEVEATAHDASKVSNSCVQDKYVGDIPSLRRVPIGNTGYCVDKYEVIYTVQGKTFSDVSVTPNLRRSPEYAQAWDEAVRYSVQHPPPKLVQAQGRLLPPYLSPANPVSADTESSSRQVSTDASPSTSSSSSLGWYIAGGLLAVAGVGLIIGGTIESTDCQNAEQQGLTCGEDSVSEGNTFLGIGLGATALGIGALIYGAIRK